MNATLERLRNALNRHDPEAMAELFAPDYRSEQPAHPNRGFGGHEQVAANWRQMFRGVPDMTAELLDEATSGATTWSEWAWHGHHTDGAPFEMRGVTVMETDDDGRITRARLYMEPVEREGAAIQDAVEELARPPE